MWPLGTEPLLNPLAERLGESRGDRPVELLVIVDDARPAAEAIHAFSTATDAAVPHYYVDGRGVVARFAHDDRVTSLCGITLWREQIVRIDEISLVIVLERVPGGNVRLVQLAGLRRLISQLCTTYSIDSASRLFSWEPAASNDEPFDGSLMPFVMPPIPVRLTASARHSFGSGDDTAPTDKENPNAPIPPLLPTDTTEAASASDLLKVLLNETYVRRGEGFDTGQPLTLAALKYGLGAPLGRTTTPDEYVEANGERYGFQVFATDTLYFAASAPQEIKRLFDLVQGEIPKEGLGRVLLDASYRATGSVLHPGWAFHQQAVRLQLGPALGNSYRVTVSGNAYALQVFAGDTLYSPVPQWQVVHRLSETQDSTLAEALQVETFRVTGRTYRADYPIHRLAVAQKLGAPLSGAYSVQLGGQTITLQVFARDTVFVRPDNTIDLLSHVLQSQQLPTPAVPRAPVIAQPDPHAPPAAAPPDPHTPPSVPVVPPNPAGQAPAAPSAPGAPPTVQQKPQLSDPHASPYQREPDRSDPHAPPSVSPAPSKPTQPGSPPPIYVPVVRSPAPTQPPATVPGINPVPDPHAPPVTSPAPAKPVQPSPEIGSGASTPFGSVVPTLTMLPVPGMPRIAQFFGYTKWSSGEGRHYYTATQGRHSGIDFAVPVGTAILAQGYGVVLCAGEGCPFGANRPLSVVVRYGGLYAIYGHMSEVQVEHGQIVRAGDRLGLSGEYGGPHLHFELRLVPASMFSNNDPMQRPRNPGWAYNPLDQFSPDLMDYFEQQYKLLGGKRHFCRGDLRDQERITFGGPIDTRPCSN